MNREETKAAILVMQAYVDGKDIEMDWDGKGFWRDKKDPNWDLSTFKYRIKEEPNTHEVIEMFYVGDYVYSSFHKKEGAVLYSSYGTVSVEFSDKSTVTFGSYHNTPSIHFLSKINKLTGFQKELIEKELKPFDWRGKNIQWIRYIDNENYSTKVLIVGNQGISYYYHDHREVKFCEWDLAKGCYEWSEDNATWRKFE